MPTKMRRILFSGPIFQEVQKYLACTNHILYANQLSMNKEKYDSLDPAYQEAINQAVAEAIEEMKSQMVESDETNKQTLVDGGMTLIEYDDCLLPGDPGAGYCPGPLR